MLLHYVPKDIYIERDVCFSSDSRAGWPLPRASLTAILWAIKVMKLNITYIIDPDTYILAVYIPKYELITITQGLQKCGGLVSNSASRVYKCHPHEPLSQFENWCHRYTAVRRHYSRHISLYRNSVRAYKHVYCSGIQRLVNQDSMYHSFYNVIKG